MMTKLKWIMVTVVLTAGILVNDSFAEQWSQFRGLHMDGRASSDFPESWSSSENVKWKIPVQGEGWSCPVVWNDKVFLTSAVRTDQEEGEENKPAPYRGGGGQSRSDLVEATYQWDVICLDTKTGKELWKKTARTGHPTIARHGTNTYATETPVTDGKNVYAYFGMNGLFCYDMEGNQKWKKDLGVYEMRAGWGTSSSPVLFEGKLFLQIDNEEQSFLIALDAGTGDELWKKNRDEPSQYSTPIIWQNSKRNELVTGGEVSRSYDPATGDLLWELNMEKGRSCATPLTVGDRLYIGTEFRNRGRSDDGGGFLFSIKPGGSGDITLKQGESSSDIIEWKLAQCGIQMASPCFCDGYIYLFERRRGLLHCVDARTGTIAYRTRVSGARAFWSSPWTDGEKIYCIDDSGTTFVFASGPEFKILDRNVIEEQVWSTPAIAESTLYIRTVDHLYSIAEK